MDKQDVQRWDNQREAILDRLKQGVVSNRELAGMALSYTRRIKDLREDGHRIDMEKAAGGHNFYRLVVA